MDGALMENNSVLRRNGYVISRNLSPDLVPVETLKMLGRETRKHPSSRAPRWVTLDMRTMWATERS